MSTTTPTDFSVYGEATLTPDKLKTINTWYQYNLGDSDKADDLLDHEYYMGHVDAFSDVLSLLHGRYDAMLPKHEGVNEKDPHAWQEKVLIGAAVLGGSYLVWNYWGRKKWNGFVKNYVRTHTFSRVLKDN